MAKNLFQNLILIFSFSSSISSFADCIVCPSAKVIFVNNTNSSPGMGTYADPYSDLQNALSFTGPCDIIYVFPTTTSYDGGGTPFQLQDNQRLLSTKREAFQLCPIICNPELPTLINTGSESVVLLANNNEVSGFNIISDINVDMNTYCIGGGILSPITNTLITNNNFTTFNNGVCAGAVNCPNLGNFIVRNCVFLAGDNNTGGVKFWNTPFADDDTQSWGIQINFCGNGSLQVFDNLFTGVDEAKGFFLPIASIFFGGNLTYSIQRNTILCSSKSVVGIGIDAVMGGFGNQSGNITNNFVRIPSVGAENHVGGIACLNRTSSDAFCISLSNNVVTSDSNIPGYYLLNTSTGLFRLDFDNSNSGTIAINVPNPIVMPPTSPFTPVSLTPLTSGCPTR